jgi:hypothetical protein
MIVYSKDWKDTKALQEGYYLAWIQNDLELQMKAQARSGTDGLTTKNTKFLGCSSLIRDWPHKLRVELELLQLSGTAWSCRNGGISSVGALSGSRGMDLAERSVARDTKFSWECAPKPSVILRCMSSVAPPVLS